MKRPPDEVIGPVNDPYMKRWFLFKPWRVFRYFLPVIYLHNILRSDNARALHDHVAWNISILLKGRYVEFGPERWFGYGQTSIHRLAGNVVFRRAKTPHSIQIPRFLERRGGGIWTIWIRGPWHREWGFHCPIRRGWVPHHQYEREA